MAASNNDRGKPLERTRPTKHNKLLASFLKYPQWLSLRLETQANRGQIVVICNGDSLRSLISPVKQCYNSAMHRLKHQGEQGSNASFKFMEVSGCMNQAQEIYNYCPDCCKAWPASDLMQHPNHQGKSFEFEGVFLWTDFITDVEEQELCQQIDQTPFVDSQSGRRKQDFGPKVNFKKRKLKCDDFSGLPNYSKTIYAKMTTNSLLHDFIPIEMCNLEYMPERGSAIDPHFDDFWLWGERLVTLNLLSRSILCMTCDEYPNMEVHIPMPRRSLLVVHGPARYKWKHSIHRQDIRGRRLAMTFRELSDEFRGHGSQSDMGQKLINIALTFNGIAVGSGVNKCFISG